MTLEHLLSSKRAAILERWFELILETYPADSARFLRQEKDEFNNPVGNTISRETEMLYDELLGGMAPEKVSMALDNILKIRAVQDYSPSQAIALVLLLKKAVRDTLESQLRDSTLLRELLAFESRVDDMVLLAADIYLKCREKIYQIRVNEVKAERERIYQMLARVNPGGGLGTG